MNTEDFCKVLYALMSVNNAQRKAAEQALCDVIQRDVKCALNNLLVILNNVCGDAVLRTFSAVLLRRTVEKEVERLSEQETAALKDQLLQSWLGISELRLLSKVSHVMAQLAFKQPWPELLPQSLHFGAQRSSHVVAVLNLIEIMSDYCPEDINTHHDVICPFLAQFLSSDNAAVRMSCAKATSTCIVALEEDQLRNSFRAAIDPMLRVLEHALAAGDEMDATMLIENLVTVAQIQPVFFKPAVEKMFGCMLSIVNAQQLDFSTRAMALEWLVTMAETAPALVRRCNGFIVNTVYAVMNIMLDMDDDVQDWMSRPYNEEDTDENGLTGDDAIERLSTSLGGKSISETVLRAVTEFSSKADWQSRRAAVAALCRLAEGSTKTFEKYLDDAYRFLFACLQDPNVRVQYEGIQALGRLVALYPEHSAEFVERFTPPLATILQNPQCCPRVRGHAASALINLLSPSQCECEQLVGFLDPLLAGLLSCLQTAPLEVRAPCLVVVGCVAQVCPEQFASYYGQFMPGIVQLIVEARAPELMRLRGKAMECAGLIGEVVGVKRFAQDARGIVQVFMEALAADTERDITFEYILPACARLSKALGADFAPFLSAVYGPLLAGANQEIQFSMEDADDDEAEGEVIQDDETGMKSTVVAFAAGVKKRVSLNTTAIEQKQQAARIFFELASGLGPHLGSFLLPSLESLDALVVNKHSSEIRSAAAMALPKMWTAYLQYAQLLLSRSAENRGGASPADCAALYQRFVSSLLQGIRCEVDATARSCLVECLRDILQGIYDHGREKEDGRREGPFPVQLSAMQAKDIVNCIIAQCAETVLRLQSMEESTSHQRDQFDEEDLQRQQEEQAEEHELLTILVDIFGQLLKLLGGDFLPVFDSVIAPAFASYWQADKPLTFQILACCLIDDALEFGGEGSGKYVAVATPVFIRNAYRAIQGQLREDDEDNEPLTLVQCSVYGLAIICRFGAPSLLLSSNLLSEVVTVLISLLQHPQARSEAWEGIRENAAYGLGSLLFQSMYGPWLFNYLSQTSLSALQLSHLWLSSLPFHADAIEAKDSAGQLVEAVMSQNPLVLGERGERIGEAIAILVNMLEESLASSDETTESSISPMTCQKIRAVLQSVRQSPSFQVLPADLQARILKYC